MGRGFGINATVPPATVSRVAQAAEEAGYDSFWVNGTPPREAIEALAAAAPVTNIPLGVGVIPLHDRPVDRVIADVKELELPEERLWLGIGYGQPERALDTVRGAVARVRTELDATVAVGAVGPRMTALSGEIGDAVIFTWWFRDAIIDSRNHIEAGARRAGHQAPPVISYIRCALLPQAEAGLEEQARAYDSVPKFAELFARYGLTARDTVVTGSSAADLQPGIEAEESVLDEGIIRAITADENPESILELLHACAPTGGDRT